VPEDEAIEDGFLVLGVELGNGLELKP